MAMTPEQAAAMTTWFQQTPLQAIHRTEIEQMILNALSLASGQMQTIQGELVNADKAVTELKGQHAE